MFCPSCGNEIPFGLKYCNRCGANLITPTATPPTVVGPPVKLAVPTIVIGLTIMVGLGIIFGGATAFAQVGIHPAAIVWIVLFSSATLLGSVALLIRFLTELVKSQRGIPSSQQATPSSFPDRHAAQQLPPRMDPVPSVTENTTRTFKPLYQEPSERGTT